jgi:RNA polymerase sigma-70 factor (ECF subfamily)
MDRESLGRYFERHRSRLLGLLRKCLDESAPFQPEDVVGEASLRATRACAGFQAPTDNPEAAVFAWLWAITRSCLRDQWAEVTAGKRDYRKKEAWPSSSCLMDRLLQSLSPTGPSTAAARREREERLRGLIACLGPDDSQILSLIDLQCLPYEAVAAEMGITEGAARVRHMRAFRRLKDLWKTSYPEDFNLP